MAAEKRFDIKDLFDAIDAEDMARFTDLLVAIPKEELLTICFSTIDRREKVKKGKNKEEVVLQREISPKDTSFIEKMMNRLIGMLSVSELNKYRQNPEWPRMLAMTGNIAELQSWAEYDKTQGKHSSGYNPYKKRGLLLKACYAGQQETVKFLLDTGGLEVTDRSKKGYNVFQAAVKTGQLEMVRWLLAREPDAAARRNLVNSPYLSFVVGGFMVGASSFEGALHLACEVEAGGVEMVALLVENGAILDSRFTGDTDTPFLRACYLGNADVVGYFLGLRGEIDITTRSRFAEIEMLGKWREILDYYCIKELNALEIATLRGHVDVVKVLVRREEFTTDHLETALSYILKKRKVKDTLGAEKCSELRGILESGIEHRIEARRRAKQEKEEQKRLADPTRQVGGKGYTGRGAYIGIGESLRPGSGPAPAVTSLFDSIEDEDEDEVKPAKDKNKDFCETEADSLAVPAAAPKGPAAFFGPEGPASDPTDAASASADVPAAEGPIN